MMYSDGISQFPDLVPQRDDWEILNNDVELFDELMGR